VNDDVFVGSNKDLISSFLESMNMAGTGVLRIDTRENNEEEMHIDVGDNGQLEEKEIASSQDQEVIQM
jgi:hypothetical protein